MGSFLENNETRDNKFTSPQLKKTSDKVKMRKEWGCAFIQDGHFSLFLLNFRVDSYLMWARGGGGRGRIKKTR